MSGEIKPCPFCGNSPEKGTSIEYVYCRYCEFEIGSIDVWNSRAEDTKSKHTCTCASSKEACANCPPDRIKIAEKEKELPGWKDAALRIGEDWRSVGPDGYYSFTPGQWLKWAMLVNHPTHEAYDLVCKARDKWKAMFEAARAVGLHYIHAFYDDPSITYTEQFDKEIESRLKERS